MYTPPAFVESDRTVQHDLIRRYRFGLLITVDDGAPVATHLPFLLDGERGPEGTLIGHMARGNPHWRVFGGEALSLAVFQGPHAYISPSWYVPGNSVPTWNYFVVHAHGRPREIDDPDKIAGILERMVDEEESRFARPWRLADQDAGYLAGMRRGIVAFEMPIERLEGKAKLSQNRGAADRTGVIAGLRADQDTVGQALADLMAAREEH